MPGMAEEYTGGMVALIPRDDDAAALVVPKGDPAGQMHLTLAYLGNDVSEMDTRQRNAIVGAAANVAVSLPPVRARVFGHATLNPDGHEGREPCAVYLVGDSPLLGPLRQELAAMGSGEQHEPFLAHVTAGYGVDQRKLSFTGPVVFDRLRVALGMEHYDFPLGEPMEKGLDMLAHIETKRQFTGAQREKLRKQGKTNDRGGFPLETREDVKNAVQAIGRAKNPESERKRIMSAAKRLGCMDVIPDKWKGGSKSVGPEYGSIEEWERFETKIMSPDPNAAKLREYWAHGAGRKKWNSFRSLRRHLAKYVHSERVLNGLTANIYHLATGTWPGRRGGEKSMPVITAEEFKAAMLLADPDADLADLDSLGDLMDDEPGDEPGEGDEDDDQVESEDDAYEQALADDFLWNIDADGQLEPDKDAPVDDEGGEVDAETPTGPRPVTEAYSLF
jgi:hypothetical protein